MTTPPTGPGAAARQGMAHFAAGEPEAAERCFREALSADNTDAVACLGLGLLAMSAGDAANALVMFDHALARDPALAAAHVNRGSALNTLGRFAEAIAAQRRALSLQPRLYSAQVNLATSLHAAGHLDEAIATLEEAVRQFPESAEVANNLGNLCKDRGEVARAASCYRAALAIDPLNRQVFSNLVALMKVDDATTPDALLSAHRDWAGWHEGVSDEAPLLDPDMTPGRRLRVGYVSPDCHTAIPAFLHPVIAGHDRAGFEVFAYFNRPPPAGLPAALGVTATARVMAGRDDAAVAAQVAADRIDILVDIAGHTGHNRLGVFARRAAPVQLTWLDYLCTTGLEAMDYRITDAVADPPGSEAHHSEALLRMPVTQWCWQPPADAPGVLPPPALANGFLTFGSFNHVQKLSDRTLARWGAILRAQPAARLVLVGIPAGAARARVAAALGVDAGRLDFRPRLDVAGYRAALNEVDIALDPGPFSGATTTLDALWQGVPVLTLPGALSCSRSAASLLAALGLDEWIARDEGDLLSRAAADPQALAVLRSGLRGRLATSPLTDAARFTRDLEALYRQAWDRWCADRREPSRATNPFAASGDRLCAAEAALAAGDADGAFAQLAPLWTLRPQWKLAKQCTARAALAWAASHPEARAAWREPVAGQARRRVSAIVCSVRPAYLAAVRGELAAQFGAHEFEVVAIDDARSLCEGYNRGARQSRGEVLVFCHDDISFPHADFGKRVLAHLGSADAVGVAGGDALVNGNWSHAGPPHAFGQVIHRPRDGDGLLYFASGLHVPRPTGIVALDGVFIAMKRRVWEAVGFDEATFDGFHLYDADFCYRAARAGFDLTVGLDLLVIHFSLGSYDAAWQKYNRRFLAKHPEITNRLPSRRDAALHVKLKTLEQVERVHTALRHHGFGR